MSSFSPETFEEVSYGEGYVQPYTWSWPEDLPKNLNLGKLTNAANVFSGQGRLIGFTVTNTNASAQFIHVFGTFTTPSNGATPVIGFSAAASQASSFFFGESGRWFHQGLTLTNSSTLSTLTIGAADCIFDVQYVPQVI